VPPALLCGWPNTLTTPLVKRLHRDTEICSHFIDSPQRFHVHDIPYHPWLPSLRRLIVSCRTAAGWFADGDLCGGVLGLPPLSLCDGVQEQDGPRWDVGISGSKAFPDVWPVPRAVRRLDPGGVEELPNKRATLAAVIIECVECGIM
jgi:hypothetical protein